MTKTIKRSLIVVLMLVFAVSAAFTATFTVKAEQTPEQAAESFKSIVSTWDINLEEEIDILADVDGQWLIDSAAKAREMYAEGKAIIDADANCADLLEVYNAVMVACDDALDFQAEINELNEALKVTSKVVIFGSEEVHVNSLEATYINTLDADEKTYIDSKFVNETVEQIIDAVQAKIAAIHEAGAEAEVAINAIEIFDGEALYGSKATLDAAIAKLTAIYGKTIEEVFAMDVRVAGDVYKEDATKVALYVSNIATYVELKAEYDAQVAIAQEVVDTINELTETVANTDATYKFLANEEAIDALVEVYEALDTSAENNLKAYVDEAVKYVDHIDDNDTTENKDDDFEVYGSKYQDLLDGIYKDQIQELVDLVLALPAADEAGIIPLKEALDNYRAKFSAVTVEQQNKVNATENADYGTIKNMYEYYNEKSTQPWAMVQYAINAIDAIELNADGEFVMSVETVAQLVNAQQKYANVPEDYKMYVTNSDKLFACEAKMEEDLVAVKDWAKQVVAIAENAPITVTNWKDVEAAYATFTEDILEEIQGYIYEEEAFRAFILKSVEGVDEDQAIQYYYDLFLSEIYSTYILYAAVDIVAYSMYDIDVVTDLTLDYDYADLPAWIDILNEVEFNYTQTLVVSEEYWATFGTELPYIGCAYGDDTRAYLAEGYGAYLKAQYDAAEEADKADFEYYNFFENYTNALAIRERYQVELAIEALTAAEDITIVDEYDILIVRSYFDALDEKNEDVLCGQDAVRNAKKLEACEEALKVITDKLDAFVAAVKALGDDATKLDLVAYQTVEDVRKTLTADELNYTGVYPSISMLAEGETDGIDFGRDVDAAVAKIDELRVEAIANINELTVALYAVTGEGEQFIALYEQYMALDASQRDAANEDILGTAIASVTETASIEDLRAAYIYAGTVANTDWLYGVANQVEELQGELEALETALDEAIDNLDEEIAAEIAAEIAEVEAKIAEEVAALETALDEAIANLDEEIAAGIAAEVEALEDTIADLKSELESKISALETKLQAAIKAEEDARKEADAALQEQIDSTRTLAIVGLVIAIVALCAAAFVIVYKVILKK